MSEIPATSAIHAGALVMSAENGSMATCSGCGIPFTPRRSDQLYHSRKCADSVRWKRKYGPEVPGLSPKDCDLFTKTLLGANKPANAFGYRLRCEELGLWFPAFGSRRWDDHRPRTDYYTLDPLELPRVPLLTLYEVGWTVPGGFLIASGVRMFIPFARKTRSVEVASRIKLVARTHDISDRLPNPVRRHEERRRSSVQPFAGEDRTAQGQQPSSTSRQSKLRAAGLSGVGAEVMGLVTSSDEVTAVPLLAKGGSATRWTVGSSVFLHSDGDATPLRGTEPGRDTR